MSMARRSLSPRDAMERWLDRQRIDKTEQTISTYYYRLKLFVEWCESEGIDEVGGLDGWLLEEFVADRQSNDPVTATMKNELVTLRKFLRYCEDIGVVDDGVAETISIPKVPPEEQSSNIKLAAEDAAALLTYYRDDATVYGSRPHALLEVFWHTGARIGGVVALDLEDRHRTDDGRYYLLFQNRPESGTRLKKGQGGERPVLISQTVWDVLDHYIEHYRDDVTDETGRNPLFTSQHGRPVKGSMRNWVYRATVPCWHSDCPHGKRRETCDWTTQQRAHKCPSSRSPHQIRTGAITWMRNRGLSADIVAKRVNAKVSTIERHYDVADPMEEMLERRVQATQNLDIEDETTTEQS
jgi:site-specific recombinase XerD